MSRHRRLCLLGSAVASAAVALSCVGDDPLPVASGTETDAAQTPDTGTPPDTGNPSVTDAQSDGAPPIEEEDAGPPLWDPLPTFQMPETISTAFGDTCTFELISNQTANAPPQWALYLVKSDSPGNPCDEPKGAVTLAGTVYSSPPVGKLLFTSDKKRLTLAYSGKENLSQQSPTLLNVAQLRPRTAQLMHYGLMKTKSVAQQSFNPSLVFVDLFFADPSEEAGGTIRLKGAGDTFPGSTGTGNTFLAKYIGFIGAQPQLPSAADSAEQIQEN